VFASFVCEELAQVIRLCWDADPSKRIAPAGVDSLLSPAEWEIVETAESRRPRRRGDAALDASGVRGCVAEGDGGEYGAGD
jgi:hypothetical protein